MIGLEPTTFCMASRRSSQLSYIRAAASIATFRRPTPGQNDFVATIEVQPRPTPGERADTAVEVEVDDALTVLATEIEDWATPHAHWELQLRQGHDFGRANNVEARLLFTGGEHTCSVTFRLDQLDAIQQFDQELWLTLEERDGIAKALHLAPNGLDVELFHVVGPPLGGTVA
jgi:hypothetical protein